MDLDFIVKVQGCPAAPENVKSIKRLGNTGTSVFPAQSFQVGVPMVFVTSQREMPADSLRGDKLLEQRSRKLDVLSGGATNHNVPGRPSIIVQILIRRDAEVEFVSLCGISVLPAKPMVKFLNHGSDRMGQDKEKAKAYPMPTTIWISINCVPQIGDRHKWDCCGHTNELMIEFNHGINIG
jgi:hypothetical protein